MIRALSHDLFQPLKRRLGSNTMFRKMTIGMNPTRRDAEQDHLGEQGTLLGLWGRFGTVMAQCTVPKEDPPRKPLRKWYLGRMFDSYRRGRDSNPRYLAVQRFSRPPP